MRRLVESWIKAEKEQHGNALSQAIARLNEKRGMRVNHSRVSEWRRGLYVPSQIVLSQMLYRALPWMLKEAGINVTATQLSDLEGLLWKTETDSGQTVVDLLKAHGKAVTDQNRMIMFKVRYGMLSKSALNGLTTDGTSTPPAPVSDATIRQAIAEESAADALRHEVQNVVADKAAGIVQRGGGKPVSGEEALSRAVAAGLASWPVSAANAARAFMEVGPGSVMLPQDLTDRITNTVTDLAHRFEGVKHALETKSSDSPDLTVPNEMRGAIEQALKKHGLPVNDTTVTETYRAMLRLAGH